MSADDTFILRCRAPDAIGIIAKVTSFLADRQLNIVESHDFGDPETATFFIRIAFTGLDNDAEISAFRSDFAILGDQLKMSWSVR